MVWAAGSGLLGVIRSSRDEAEVHYCAAQATLRGGAVGCVQWVELQVVCACVQWVESGGVGVDSGRGKKGDRDAAWGTQPQPQGGRAW